MRILLYSWPFAPSVGGLERLTEMTAVYASGAGHQVTVVTSTPDRDGRYPKAAFDVDRQPGLRHLATLVRRADVVHLNTFSLPIVALALLFRRPIVWQHIDFDTVSPRGICHADGRPCQFALARCYRCLRRDYTRVRAIKSIVSLLAKRAAAHAVTFNLLSTEYARRRMPLPRLKLLSFGIDTDFWTPAPRPPSPTLRVFFYGRHIPGKGCDVLVRAVRHCRDEGVSLSVRIGGDGPHRAASERLSRELGLSDTITFLGFQPEDSVRAELRSADVVAVPTLQDEIGQFVVFEAMACGCAVVASNIGAFPEHLDGGAGVLFPAGDDAQLARILSRLSLDPPLVAALAGRGRNRVRADFDWRLMGRRYLDLYARVA